MCVGLDETLKYKWFDPIRLEPQAALVRSTLQPRLMSNSAHAYAYHIIIRDFLVFDMRGLLFEMERKRVAAPNTYYMEAICTEVENVKFYD